LAEVYALAARHLQSGFGQDDFRNTSSYFSLGGSFERAEVSTQGIAA
jgi:hypothetical protein